MVIGDRQRHCNLTIIPLAELAAVLRRHANRVPPLLGKTRVVDDPRIDRPMALDCRQHHLAYLLSRLTKAPRRRNAVATDAAPQRLPEPSPPPSAPHSSARTASPNPCNNPVAVPPDPHGRSRSQAHQQKPQTAIQCPLLLGDPSQPPLLKSESLIISTVYRPPFDPFFLFQFFLIQ